MQGSYWKRKKYEETLNLDFFCSYVCVCISAVVDRTTAPILGGSSHAGAEALCTLFRQDTQIRSHM